jgi:hypothetical protein
LTLLVWLSVGGPARAETWVGDSLEWMTDDCALILRAKVIKSVEVKFPGAGGFYDQSLNVLEVLKGKFQGMELVIRSWEGEAKEGRECLFFLKKGQDVYGPTDYRRPVVAEHWTQRVFWNGNPMGAIDLQAPGGGHGVVTAQFTVLKKRDQVLAAVRDRILHTKNKPPLIKPAEKDAKTGVVLPPLGVVRLDAPWDSAAHKAFYGGSAVWAYVPADPGLKPKILALLKEQRTPELVAALANYPGQDTEKMLKDFLNDPTTSETFSDGKVIHIDYPVRAAAYGALLRLGVVVPPPVLSKKPGA